MRPEEILEVEALVATAAEAFADVLVARAPYGFSRSDLFDLARAEFMSAAEDVARMVHVVGGRP